MDPEDNFENWVQIVYELCVDAEQFKALVPTIERVFNTIRDTGFLFVNSQDPDHFVRGIINRVVNKILFIKKPSSSQVRSYYEFFKCCLRFSLVGFGTCDSTFISLATSILGENQYDLYTTSRKQLYQRLCQFYVGINAMDIMLDFMTERCQNFQIFNSTLNLYSKITKYSEDFSFDNVAEPISQSILKLLRLNPQGFKILPETLQAFRSFMPLSRGYGDFFVKSITPILNSFLGQNSFDQKRIFFSILQLMINDKYLALSTAKFISENSAIIDDFQFHVEYAEALSDILCGMAKEGLLKTDTIRKVWSLHSSRHDSEIKSYIKMFVTIAETAKNECLHEVIECIATSDNANPVWFQTVDALVEVLIQENSLSEITRIKDTLLTIVFNTNHPCFKQARQSLLNIVAKQADMQLFEFIFQKLNDPTNDVETVIFCFNMLKAIIQPKLKLSPPYFLAAIGKCIDYILYYQNDKIPPELFTFIEETYKSMKMEITPEIIQRLLPLRNVTDQFYPFFTALCDKGVMDNNTMLYFVKQVPIEEWNKSFYIFVKHMMKKVNCNPQNETINKLPLENDELIWNYATKPSPIRDMFEKLLCQLYFSNDGDALTDEDMINYFINRWKHYDINDPTIINLLIRFISEIEDVSLTDVERRMPDKQTIHVTASCVEPEFTLTFNVGSSATIGYVNAKIAKIRDVRINTIQSFYNQIECKRTRPILAFVEPGTDSVTLEIKYRTAKKGKRVHERDCYPSEIISKTSLPDELYPRLAQGDETVYKLLNLLPTIQTSHQLLAPLVTNGIYQNDVFNLSAPYVFLYNITTLDNYFTDESRRNQLLLSIPKSQVHFYFIQCIDTICNNKLLEQKVYSEIAFEIIRFFTNYEMEEANQVQLFVAMLKLASSTEDKLMFTHIQNVINKNFKTKNRSIPYPGPDFDPILNMLLSENQKKRLFAVRAFNSMNMPISVFINVIQNLGNNVTDDFIDCMNEHINDQYDNQNIEQLSSMLFSLITESDTHLKNILRSFNLLLSFGLLPFNLSLTLTKFIIDKFFVYNMKKEIKSAFTNAVLCLTYLCDVKDTSIEDNDQLLLHRALQQHHIGIKPFSSFSSRQDACLISDAGKVGLTNMGATCYIGSSLQQLFAIPALRNAIINYKGDKKDITSLSNIFTRMLYSTCKTESISDFVKNFSWWGAPLNPREQQDAVEFIETLLSSNLMEDKDIGPQIKDLCQGKTQQCIRGTDVNYKSVSFQDFTCLECDINSSTKKLSDSIALYQQVDYLIGNAQYYTPEGKIDATRKSFIAKSPPILIIFLKRFEYDYSKQQRNKITTPLEIPLELDISPASDNPKPIYKLNGVVVHRGLNALGGHYVSYVSREHEEKDNDKWTLFNDDEVTVVSESQMFKEVNGSETSVGYILFYVLPEVMKEDGNISPNEDIKRDIDMKNEENRLKTLYFTNNYFDLMQALSSRVTTEYDDILQLYTIDMLPFSQFAGRCSDFMDNIVKKATSLFVDTLTERYFKDCVFSCPYDEYRVGFCKILEKSLTKTNCDLVFNESFKLIDAVLSDYSHLDSIFHVIYSILTLDQETFDKYSEQILKRIYEFFTVDVKNYLAGEKGLNESYFYSGLDISYILKICVLYNDIPQELKSESFLIMISTSQSSPQSIADYIKKFYSEEQFIQFITAQSRSFRPMRLLSLLACVIPDTCIQTFFVFPIQPLHGDNSDHDRSTTIALCAANNPEVRDALILNRSEWLERFLWNETPSVRQNAEATVAHLIGDESLKILSSISLNQEMYIPQPAFKVRESKEEIQKNSTDFTQTIVEFIPKLIQKLIVDVKAFKATREEKSIRANEYLELLSRLLVLSTGHHDLTPLSQLIPHINCLSPYSHAMTTIMNIFYQFNIPISPDDLILSIKGNKFIAKKAILINEFLEYFLPLCKRLHNQLPEEVITFFVQNIAFNKTKHFKKSYPIIRDFLVYLCGSIFKTHVMQYIDLKFKTVCDQNLPSVCIALKALGRKHDVFPYLSNALTDEMIIPQEELVQLVVDCNSKPIRKTAISDIVTMENLSPKARQILCDSSV